MTEAIYTGDDSWTYANCYSCGKRLAEASNIDIPGRDPTLHSRVFISSRLVARPALHEGRPHYAPTTRAGDPVRHGVGRDRRAGGLVSRRDFYVNCWGCDRGQVVHISKMRRVGPAPSLDLASIRRDLRDPDGLVWSDEELNDMIADGIEAVKAIRGQQD